MTRSVRVAAMVAFLGAGLGLPAAGCNPPDLTLTGMTSNNVEFYDVDGDRIFDHWNDQYVTLTMAGAVARDDALDNLAIRWSPPYDCYDCIPIQSVTVTTGRVTYTVRWSFGGTPSGLWPDDERLEIAQWAQQVFQQIGYCTGPWIVAEPGCQPRFVLGGGGGDGDGAAVSRWPAGPPASVGALD